MNCIGYIVLTMICSLAQMYIRTSTAKRGQTHRVLRKLFSPEKIQKLDATNIEISNPIQTCDSIRNIIRYKVFIFHYDELH